jgi:hypothetical protein
MLDRARARAAAEAAGGGALGGLWLALPPGWHQFDEGVQRRGPCWAIANTLAANWRADWAGSHSCAAEMPPDGIAISVGLFGPVKEGERHPEYLPVGEFPLRLPAKTVNTRRLRLPDWPQLCRSAG